MPERLKGFLYGVLALGLSGLVTLVLFEVVLTFFPVMWLPPFKPTTSEAPIMRYQGPGEFTYSYGAAMGHPNRGRVNAQGYVNPRDYSRDGKPVMAVIGDSYIEALMVAEDRTLQSRLQGDTDNNVFSFGVSGAPMSQYLVWARDARDTYRPEALVIPIISNDFDESLLEYGVRDGMHYFDEAGDLVLRPYRPRPMSRILRHSALMRWLVYNVKITALIRRAAEIAETLWSSEDGGKGEATPEEPRYVANTNASTDGGRVEKSRQAVDWFLERISDYSGLPRGRILFLVDGIRPALYDGKALERASDSYVGVMRDYFLAEARAAGFPAIDLTGPMQEHFAATGERMETPWDNHWSGVGHGVAAEVVRSHELWASFTAQ